MCRTPEEAAWTLLSETAESQGHRVIAKLLRDYGKSFVQVDIRPSVSQRLRVIKVTCEFGVSNEVFNEVSKEVEHEPSLVGRDKGSSSE